MITIVFGATTTEAERKLREILSDFNTTILSSTTVVHGEAILPNGDRFYAKSLTQEPRGFRCDRVYVSHLIKKDIVDLIVKPMLVTSWLPVEERLIFY